MRDHNTIDINLTRFHEVNPLLYAGEHPAPYLDLKVPVLMGVPLDVTQKIRDDEQDALERFTRRFFRMVKDHETKLESEKALAEGIDEVDDAIQDLEQRYQSIRRTRLRNYADATVAMGFTCLCLFLPPEISKFLAALFGGKAGSAALNAFGRYRESLDDLRRDDSYVPWLITHEGK